MSFDWSILLFFFLGVASTLLLGWLAIHRKIKLADEQRKNLLIYAQKEAEQTARDILAEAKEEASKHRMEVERELSRRELRVEEGERQLLAEQESLEKACLEVEERSRALYGLSTNLDDRQEEIERLGREYRRQMARLGEISVEEIRTGLRNEVKRACEDELRELRKDILNKSEAEINREAQRVLIDTLQRLSTRPQNDITATIVPLPSEDMKGRIIGREGRNIKAFEMGTGVTLLIDETPDSVLVSSFDPVRREIARIALEALVRDGRIHPTSIEDAIAQAEEEVLQNVTEHGEEALRQLHLTNMHPEIIQHIGKMRYRLANNQNCLDHSIEVAYMCSIMASELGLEPELAKRAGLLHDIGKVIDHEFEGSHAIAGAQMLKRHGEDERVINAVAAHHNEVPAESPYAALVMTADSASAMRPGARAESMDAYVQRVRTLEDIARSMPGVMEAFAIQAGREVRVIVSPEKVSDEDARMMSRRIRAQIEEEMQYPGSIRVTVIRESRFTETAK